MHPLVRDLYKRFLVVGRDYPHPEGLQYVRRKVKEAFFKNADLKTDAEINKAIHKGRWWVKEMIGVIQLKKHRTMMKRYDPPRE